MSKYRVEKQSYSRGAWRVLDAATGEQVWKRDTFYHGVMGRTVTVPAPVCFERKRDAVAWVQAQESPINDTLAASADAIARTERLAGMS